MRWDTQIPDPQAIKFDIREDGTLFRFHVEHQNRETRTKPRSRDIMTRL